MDLGRWLRLGRGLAHQVTGLNRRARARLDGSRACILNYHRVIPADVARRDLVEGGMYVTPEAFRLELELLKDLFEVMPLGELSTRIKEERSLPERACAITFDDGWRDNLVYGLPELQRAGLPATVFVVTERIGSEGAFWPDEVWRRLGPLDPEAIADIAQGLGATASVSDVAGVLEHLKLLPEEARAEPLEELRARTQLDGPGERELLDWDEATALKDGGVAIESHGATHAILTGLESGPALAELQSSLRTLVERGFADDRLFAYPSGQHDARIQALATEAGYRSAFVLDEQLVELGAPDMALSRMGMHQGIGASRLEFLCKVPGSA